ncbi:MAG: type II secretion system protein GspL [Gammaproteobacteria bacterium]|nr:type II secretion system protein GspL [Gammaproteobacteria bacterium]
MATSTLYIRWIDGQSPQQFAWYKPTSQQGRSARRSRPFSENSEASSLNQGVCDLATLQGLALGLRLVLIVPGRQVHLASVKVPSRNQQKVAQAVPYALEDELSEEIDDLHFVVSRRATDAGYAVAVTSHRSIADWLHCFDTVALRIDQISVDTLLLPVTPGHWTLLLEPQGALLRQGEDHAMALPLASLDMLLVTLLDGVAAESEAELPAIILYDLRPDGSEPLIFSEQVAAQLKPQPLPAHGSFWQLPLIWSSPLQLLQGRYSRQEQLGKLLKPWRAVALLSLLLAALLFAERYVTYTRQQAALHDLVAQQTQIYRDAFPGSRNVVNPQVQMQQQLAQLRRSDGGQAGFLTLLNSAAPHLLSDSGNEIHALRYRQQRLELTMQFKSLAAIDSLKGRLEAAQLLVTIDSATSRGDTVEGRLTVMGSAV